MFVSADPNQESLTKSAKVFLSQYHLRVNYSYVCITVINVVPPPPLFHQILQQ